MYNIQGFITLFQAHTLQFLAAFLLLLFLARKKILFHVATKNQPPLQKKPVRHSLPYYVNGWFFLCNSEQLKKGTALNYVVENQNLALFRGHDGVAYCIGAYCGHLGANLAIGGKVVNKNSLQCPFHGWLYNGATGMCQTGGGKPKVVYKYTYPDDLGLENSKCQLKCQKGFSQNKTYSLQQISGKIYVWIHALGEEPTYRPLDLSSLSALTFRGYSVNKIHSHVQDIPQNGADINHFIFVHKYLHKNFRFIQLFWTANWQPADTLSAPYHPVQKIHDFKQRIFKTHLNGQDLSKLGIINLQLNVKVPFFPKFNIYNITGIQLGPGVVYLFIKSFYSQDLLFHYLSHPQKLDITVCQQYWAHWSVPWIFSWFLIKMELIQIGNDGKMWSNKQQIRDFRLTKEDADQTFLAWKKWHMQFYKGRKQRSDLEW